MSASGWSTKVTPMSKDKTSNTEANKYLYLYTCEQREMADGTISYTPVLLDDTTTVIDGGNIITGTVTANQIAANAITVGKLASDIQSDITNAKKHTQVIISATNINYMANTCTLTARLYIDGVLQTSTSLKWQ